MHKPVFPNTAVLFAATRAALAARARDKLAFNSAEHGDAPPSGPPRADGEGPRPACPVAND